MEGRRGRGRRRIRRRDEEGDSGGWATAAAAARPGSQNSHDDFLSGISAGYVILWHKIILLLMIDIAKKDILTDFM